MKYVLALTFFVCGLAHGATCTMVPTGATALGYTTQLFYDQPNLTEVSDTDTDSTSKWYPGSYSAPISHNLSLLAHLNMVSSELSISLGGGVSSETHASKAGAMPLLSGAKGFYVEFAMRLSTNDTDHFSGLFLQTAEHDLHLTDHLATDPAGYERWTEIDVSEGGYGPGSLATAINWSGYYRNYSPQVFNNYGHEPALDWTVEHIFGVSYDPITNVLQYYIDDVPSYKITLSNSVIKDYHYYLIMEASSHGLQKPYNMFIRYVTAYTKSP